MNKFEKILLTVFFVEVFVGGGGRLIDFGVISIRQLLFLLLIVTFIVRIIKDKAIFNIKKNTFFRFNPVTIGIYVLIFWFVVSALIGFVNGNSLGAIVTDFFRVYFFVAYFPLAYYISKERFPLHRIIKILKYCVIVVAIFTITVSLLGKTIFSNNFLPFYNFMNTIMNDDLFFRPSNSVFYKSHFFVLIGLILSLNSLLSKNYGKLDIAVVLVGAVSILWSETRGFLLAFMLSLLMIILLDIKILLNPLKGLSQKFKKILQSKQFIQKFTISLMVMVAVPFLYKYMTLERFEQTAVINEAPPSENQPMEEKVQKEVNDVSVNVRMEILSDATNILKDPKNLIIGSGYGTEIAKRTYIEISFLDILVKQGLIGLAIWGFLFLMVFYNYYQAYRKGQKLSTLDISLLAAFMGILLLTNINPFINNTIGISFFLVLLVVSQNKKELKQNEELV